MLELQKGTNYFINRKGPNYFQIQFPLELSNFMKNLLHPSLWSVVPVNIVLLSSQSYEIGIFPNGQQMTCFQMVNKCPVSHSAFLESWAHICPNLLSQETYILTAFALYSLGNGWGKDLLSTYWMKFMGWFIRGRTVVFLCIEEGNVRRQKKLQSTNISKNSCRFSSSLF